MSDTSYNGWPFPDWYERYFAPKRSSPEPTTAPKVSNSLERRMSVACDLLAWLHATPAAQLTELERLARLPDRRVAP